MFCPYQARHIVHRSYKTSQGSVDQKSLTTKYIAYGFTISLVRCSIWWVCRVLQPRGRHREMTQASAWLGISNWSYSETRDLAGEWLAAQMPSRNTGESRPHETARLGEAEEIQLHKDVEL